MRYKSGILIFAVLFAWLGTHAQSGCTDPAATNYNAAATSNDGSCTYAAVTINPILKHKLPSALGSCSGLVWTNGNLWTHNDSGNPADIYRIDTATGAILQTVKIGNYPNTDWEDITADSLYIYVSDCGNNNGDRTDLKILKIAKADITIGSSTVTVNAQAINLSYTDQTSFASSSTNNYDCESIAAIKDSLYLFTKDRGDLKTRVYRLPKTPGTYAVSPITSLNANGLVTGADYDPVTKEVVLIGYMQGHVNSFMWFMNDFKGDDLFSGDKRRVELGNGQEWQTEGVTYIAPGRFFISNEVAGNIDQSLWVSAKAWPTPPTDTVVTLPNAAVNAVNAIRVTYYPNPATGVLHLNDVPVPCAYTIIDMQGRVAQRGTLNAGSNSVDIASLEKASYILQMKREDGGVYIVKVVKE